MLTAPVKLLCVCGPGCHCTGQLPGLTVCNCVHKLRVSDHKPFSFSKHVLKLQVNGCLGPNPADVFPDVSQISSVLNIWNVSPTQEKTNSEGARHVLKGNLAGKGSPVEHFQHGQGWFRRVAVFPTWAQKSRTLPGASHGSCGGAVAEAFVLHWDIKNATPHLFVKVSLWPNGWQRVTPLPRHRPVTYNEPF